MIKILYTYLLPLLLWGIFIYTVLQIPYPQSITQANLNQLLLFFVPLFLSIVLTLNIFLKNIFISLFISFGLIFILILKSLDSLNIVTGVLTTLAVGLLISYFRRKEDFPHFKKTKRKGLTYESKIPKIHRIRKQ